MRGELKIQEAAEREEYLNRNLGLTQAEIRKESGKRSSSESGEEEGRSPDSDQYDYERGAEYAESDRRELQLNGNY